MKQKKVVIIGGGIAGLCTGVYLRKHGFETEILEMHAVSGGLATAWVRKGYTFENCVHWFVGSAEGKPLNATWKEVFDIGRLRFLNDPVYQVLEKAGRSMVIHRAPGALERELIAKAPEDKSAIKEFARNVRKFSKFRFPEGDSLPANLFAMIRMIPYLPALSKYGKTTMGKLGQNFRDPLLRAFFTAGLEDLSALAIIMSLAWMADGNAGYPIGGSPALIGLIEEHYRELGGRIRFKERVERILVENGRASGVRLAGGETVAADVVVSAADGRATIFDMLDGKYIGPKHKKAYETYRPFPSYVLVSFGVAADMSGEPGSLVVFQDPPVEIDPQTRAEWLFFRIFNFDPTFAPEGKTSVVAFLATYNDTYWRNLRVKNMSRYQAEKKQIADRVTAAFEARFPQAKGKFEVVDIATPATVERYTGNWRGSMEGWLLTPTTGFKSLPTTLPGLKDFYMAGQWLSPGGGLPSGVMTGRAVARRICRKAGIRWKPRES